MNLTNLFGNKNKQPEPEYFLAVEIHESLIKTALWEILDSEPSVTNIGSFESWEDESSLINGVDMSLDQAVKVISSQPKRVIFGLPDSWMEEDKIHPTKIKLVSKLCKDLGLEPIGAVTINRAVAHYLKKRGCPSDYYSARTLHNEDCSLLHLSPRSSRLRKLLDQEILPGMSKRGSLAWTCPTILPVSF
jgi:hypothetical protein